MRKYIITALALAAVMVGCTKKQELSVIDEIGCTTPVDTVAYQSGSYVMEILSNGDFVASLPEDASWLRFKDAPDARQLGRSGDVTIGLEYDINRSIPRKAELTLSRGSNTFVFVLVQKGLLQGGLDIEQKILAVDAQGGTCSAKVITRLKPSDFTFDVAYDEPEQGQWIGDIRLQNNFITFNAQPNFSKTDIRHARINISYPEGKALIYVSQFNVGNVVENVSISQLKDMVGPDGSFVSDSHYVVSGVVVNDNSQNNGAQNRIISVDAPDPAYSSRILYLEEPDGSDAIKVVFKESAANLASLYDRVGIDTYGLTVRRYSDPERYEIASVPVSAAIESERAERPVIKVKSIAELEPSDIGTLVRLTNVQIPVRKGNYLPIDIRYYAVIPTYPMLLSDAQGSSIYMMVNANCPWAKDGHAMPAGSGDVTGLVVCEPCDNVEWDSKKEKELLAQGLIPDYISGIGYPGSYQIRPMRKEDIELAEELDESFSSLLYEWRYCDGIGEHLVQNYDNESHLLYPTYPAVPEPMTLPATLSCNDGTGAVDLNLCNDFTHLGPYKYGGNISQPRGGNGVFDYMGRSAHWNVWGSTASIGVIYSHISGNKTDWTVSNGSAWCSSAWTTKKYWCVNFPTTELDASNAPLTVSFGAMHAPDNPGAPRYWAVEYSLDGYDWTRVCEYTVPDFVVAANRKPWQMPGTKYVSAKLPDSLLGRETVFVRLVPASMVAGTTTTYEGGNVASARHSALNYFAIRYNK